MERRPIKYFCVRPRHYLPLTSRLFVYCGQSVLSRTQPENIQSVFFFFFLAWKTILKQKAFPLRTLNALKAVVEFVRYEIWRRLPAVLTVTAMMDSTTITSTEPPPSPMKGFHRFDWTGSRGMAKYSCTTRSSPALNRRAPENDNREISIHSLDTENWPKWRFHAYTYVSRAFDDFTFDRTVDHMANDSFASVRV